MRPPRAPAIDRPSAPAPSLALTSAMVLSRLVTAEQRPPDRLISRRFPARSKAFHELRPPEAPPTHARDGGGGVDDEGALLLPPLVRPQCGLQRLQQGGPTPRDLAARTLEPTPSAPQVLLIHLALPWTVSALQLGLGLMYIVPLWLTGLRTPPNLSIADVKGMVPVSLIHAAGQAVTVAPMDGGAAFPRSVPNGWRHGPVVSSTGAGSLAFVNVVKSLEPFFNVVFGALLLPPDQASIATCPRQGGLGVQTAGSRHLSKRQ